MEQQDFTIERRIYYHNTDAGGVVYYANYLKLLEEGRTEFCRSRGIDTGKLWAQGIGFPVVHVEVDYKSPARYADLIRIATRIEKVGNSSLHFSQEITRDGQLLVRAKTVWACVGGGQGFKSSIPLPAEVTAKLT
ncbi:MAG: acyl-CoA thioesterase [Deltaproteobacteria bacterium]